MNPTRKILEVSDPVKYGAYLRLLARIITCIEIYYTTMEGGDKTSEAQTMSLFMQRFLSTIRALQLKYAFSPMYLKKPGIDLTDSGFPEYYDLTQMAADLATKNGRLANMAPFEDLREQLLDKLMLPLPDESRPAERTQQEDERRRTACQLSERAYLEMLDPDEQFFLFTQGSLTQLTNGEWIEREKGRRNYLFTFGCYDTDTNTPSVYFMVFTQEEKEGEAPLHKSSSDYQAFLQVVQHVAGRTHDRLDAIGASIDRSFKNLSPRALKRITIGPLISPSLYKGVEGLSKESLASKVLPYFTRARLADDEFLVFFEVEFVFSKGEVTPESFIEETLQRYGGQKKRQLFYVPKNDKKLQRRGAGYAKTYALMPHRLGQHLSADALSAMGDFAELERLMYQKEEGTITNVG